MKKAQCPFCEKEVWIEDYQDESVAFCSPEHLYEYETGHPGEQY